MLTLLARLSWGTAPSCGSACCRRAAPCRILVRLRRHAQPTASAVSIGCSVTLRLTCRSISTTAWQPIASPRPMWPTCSPVFALTFTASGRQPEQLGQVVADRRLDRAELRLLGEDRHVHIDRPPAAPGSAAPASRAGTAGESASLPARVGVRVSVADVAEAGGAEQGVGDGVQHHVGVAVAGQAARVRRSRTPPRISGRPSASRCVSCPMPTRMRMRRRRIAAAIDRDNASRLSVERARRRSSRSA